MDDDRTHGKNGAYPRNYSAYLEPYPQVSPTLLSKPRTWRSGTKKTPFCIRPFGSMDNRVFLAEGESRWTMAKLQRSPGFQA